MNAHEHAPTGAAAGVLTAPAAAAFGAHPAVWIGAVLAGSIILDVDHVGSSVARMWGPVSRGIAAVVSPLSGGHRGLTHGRIDLPRLVAAWTVAAVLVVGVATIVRGGTPVSSVAWIAGQAVAHVDVAAAFVWAFVTGAAITAADRSLGRRPVVPWPVNLAASGVVGVAAWAGSWPVAPVLVGVAVGGLVHVAGDTVRTGSRTARVLVAGSYIVVAATVCADIYLRTRGATT